MAKVSQDGYILPLGGREETVFKWMCFPNHHAGKNAATGIETCVRCVQYILSVGDKETLSHMAFSIRL